MERPLTRPPRDLFGPAVISGFIGLCLAELSVGGIGGFLGFWLAFLGYFLARAMVIRIVREELQRAKARRDAH